MQKTLSIILAILMIATTIPFAFAADEAPPTREIDGETYYELDSAEDYLWFVKMCNDSVNLDDPDYENQLDKYYYIPYNAILTADIVLNNNVIVDGELTADTSSLVEVTPIANYYVKFPESPLSASYYTGTFDGNGYSISGLYINSSGSKVAMFRNVYSDGVIKNLHLKDSYVSGESDVSGIVGGNEGTVSGCSFDGIVFATRYYAGGIVASNSGGIIENCHNSAHVHSSGYMNAGIAISNGGTIRNCYNTGTIGNTTRAYDTAGIVGKNYGSIENCYNIGEILRSSVSSSVSAIACSNQQNATITNCYFDSDAFSGPAVNYDAGTTKNVEGKTAAEFADGTVCELVGYHVGGEATCTAKAVCETCRQPYGEALGHDIVIDEAVAPTCTETGLTEASHCSRCDDMTVAQEVIPANGHTPLEAVKENEVAPKCGVAGSYDLVVYCDVCDEELDRDTTTVNALGHADENGDGICDNGGEQLTCEDCGRPVHEGFIQEVVCWFIMLINLVKSMFA